MVYDLGLLLIQLTANFNYIFLKGAVFLPSEGHSLASSAHQRAAEKSAGKKKTTHEWSSSVFRIPKKVAEDV